MDPRRRSAQRAHDLAAAARRWLPKPIAVKVDLDAGLTEQMIDRLTVLRMQMLPKPSPSGSRTRTGRPPNLPGMSHSPRPLHPGQR